MNQKKSKAQQKQLQVISKSSPKGIRDVTDQRISFEIERTVKQGVSTYVKVDSSCMAGNSNMLPEGNSQKRAVKQLATCLTKRRSRAPSKTKRGAICGEARIKESRTQSNSTIEVEECHDRSRETSVDHASMAQSRQESGLGEKSEEKSSELRETSTNLGPAARHLHDNPYAQHLGSVVSDDDLADSNSTVRQLRHAILGSGLQCPHCLKFQGGSLKWQKQHAYDCQRTQVYRVNFITIDSLYFCYYGCVDKYEDRLLLIQHLLAEHRESLPDWGLSPDRLDRLVVNRQQRKRTNSKDVGTQTLDSTAPPEQSRAEPAQSKATNKDGFWSESWHIQQLMSMTVDGDRTERLASIRDLGRTIRLSGKLMRLYSLDKLRGDVQTTCSIISHVKNEHLLAEKFPSLGMRPCQLQRHSESVISIIYPFDARTPMMLWKDSRMCGLKRCFIKALGALTMLHRDFEIFQGGIRRNTMALTDQGNVVFLDWSHSRRIGDAVFGTVPSSRTYPHTQAYRNKQDFFNADLSALAITFEDLARSMSKGESMSNTPFIKRLCKQARKASSPEAYMTILTHQLLRSEKGEMTEDQVDPNDIEDMTYDEFVETLGMYMSNRANFYRFRAKKLKRIGKPAEGKCEVKNAAKDQDIELEEPVAEQESNEVRPSPHDKNGLGVGQPSDQ